MESAHQPLRVSVVVPAHNEERDLPECLRALTQQSVKPYEIIVVDNNSTDSTRDIAKEYGARVVSESQQGITYARTAGFNAAQGDIIARTDADTFVCRDWVRAIGEALEDTSVLAVTGHTQIEELSQLPRPFQMRRLLPMLSKIHALSLKGPILYGFNMAMRRTVWEEVQSNLHDTHTSSNEDVQLTIKIRRLGAIRVVPAMHVKCKVKDVLQLQKISRYLFDDLKTSLSVRSRRK